MEELRELVAYKTSTNETVPETPAAIRKFDLTQFENLTLDCSNINIFAHTKYDSKYSILDKSTLLISYLILNLLVLCLTSCTLFLCYFIKM